MSTVRVSEEAISGGATAIERELIQLRVIADKPGSGAIEIAPDQDAEVLRLARWRGFTIAKAQSEATTTVLELWKDMPRVTAIIACHNYGHYLDEAIRSLLSQSYLPDEIILSDDASTDDSPEIMKSYEAMYPELIRLNLNEKNLGIQVHFNEVVGKSRGDLVVIIGADNRVPVNYIEEQFVALASDETVGLAYTDFALFGGRAKNDYDRMLPAFRGDKLPNGVYLSNFPEYDLASQQLLREGHNFIHGSSMYRRSVFDEVGGYIDRKDGPEDMSLFQAMLGTGTKAQKVHGTVLEYRQHSAEQANYQFSYFGELQRLREEHVVFESLKLEHAALNTSISALQQDFNHLVQEHQAVVNDRDALRAEVVSLSALVQDLRESLSFRLGNSVVAPISRVVSTIRRKRNSGL